MGPVFYVMAILGCGEADATCQQVDVAQAQYASAEECNAATPEQLERRIDLAYPVVVAQCHRADQKLSLDISPDDVMLPEGAPAQQPQRAADTGKVRLAARN